MRRYCPVLSAAMVLVLALAGCGCGAAMDLAEYRERISDLHDGVASGLGLAFERLSTLSYDDYFGLVELEEVFARANEVFRAAVIEGEDIQPPSQADSLHRDLLDFYSGGEDKTAGIQNMVSIFEAVLPMLRDMENLALPQLPSEADLAAAAAAAAEDHITLRGYIDDIEGFRPPDELQDYLDRLSEFFTALDDSISGVEQGTTPEDKAALETFKSDYALTMEAVGIFWEQAMEYLRGVEQEVDCMIERGEELAARVYEL